MEKLFEYKRFGFSLVVYPNTIAVVDKSGGLKGLAAPRQTDILIKNITGIYLSGLTRKLRMTLNDGTYREFPIYGKDSEKVIEIVSGMI